MKLREIFRYELEHRLRSPATWAYAAILLGIAFLVMRVQTEDVRAVQANAPVSLAVIAVGIGMFGMLMTAALFGDAAVRDVEVGMDALLFTTPVGKAEYLGGRFLAALAMNAVVLLAIPLGLAAGTLVPSPLPAVFGPFRAAAFLQPYLLFLLPNLVLTGAILFTVGALTRQVIPVYLAAVGVILGCLTAAQSADRIDHPVLTFVGDPAGMLPLLPMAEYWTAAEKNARLIGFPVDLFWNRVIWLAVAVAVLAALHRVFRFAHPDGAGRRRRGRTVGAAETERIEPVTVPRVAGACTSGRLRTGAKAQPHQGSFGFRTTARQTLAVARDSLATVVANRWFAVLLLAYVGLAVLFGLENMPNTPFDTKPWPATVLVIEAILDSPILLITFLLVALYAGELVWKERDVGMAEIADATLVPDGAFLFGRYLALVAMVAMLQAAIMAGSILTQTLAGYHHFEVGLYLRILFGLHLADLVLLAALAMTIHVVLNHKYLGHIVVLLACVFPILAEETGILRHHLLLYGTDSKWTYSDMNGFGPFIGPFVWFKLYWGAWALLLGVVACVSWVRGRESGVRRRLSQARARFTGPVVRTAAVAIALILGLGGFIFYNTNILNEYSTTDGGAPHAAYEKRYKRFEDVPQPTITGVQLRVEIYPDEPAVDLRGSYSLMNRSGAALDSVHVVLVPDVATRALSLNRAAEPVLVDEEAGYRIFALAQPLQPGDSVRLAFDVTVRPRGFPNSGLQTAVARNGAYFNHRGWLPYIGYQPRFELPGTETRERSGLPPRPPLPAPDDTAPRRYRGDERNDDRVLVDAIIGTAADQTAVTLGVLRRSWTENGRRYFHYQTEAPMGFGGTVFSGDYAVREDRWKDVALEIFHHRAHSYNLDPMVRGMKAALAYFTVQFGPYPASQLRIAEFPRYGGFGHAHPYTIAFSEDVFLSRVKEGEIDLPFYGTVHEVAHQWWGGQVQGAAARGHRFLTESLANYSATIVMEKTYGPDVARRVYDFHMDLYLRGRAFQAREVPLLEVTDQSYIAYRRGAVAMLALRDHIGEEAVNTALRRYLEKYGEGRGLYPTSLDLYAELRAVTPDSLRHLLTDWFETVTLWDVSTKRAVVERNDAGEYMVTLDVVAKKLRADSLGNETEVPMNDLFEIGVFAAGEGNAHGEQLYLQRHRIRGGAQTIRIAVPRPPARAGIDPWHKLIDRERDNNVVDVTAGDADPAGADS